MNESVKTLEQLLEAAGAADSLERGRAAEALGEREGEAVLQVLLDLLQDRDPVVRFKAAVSLAQQGDASGCPILLWGLKKTELCAISLDALLCLEAPPVREEMLRFFRRWRLHPIERVLAAGVLQRCGSAEGSRFLEACLGSRRPEERGMAIELYGRLKLTGALDVLQGILADAQDPNRMDAVRGLLWLGDRRCLPLLRRVAREEGDAELAELAAQAQKLLEAEDD